MKKTKYVTVTGHSHSHRSCDEEKDVEGSRTK